MKRKLKKPLVFRTVEEVKLEYLPQAYKEEILDTLTLEEHVEYYIRRDLRSITGGRNPTDEPKSEKVSTLEKIDRILDK